MWDTLILNPMMNALLWIYDLLANNFGLAIIVFTILVRLITYPLTAQQMKSTQKMQEFQKSKEWQDVQTKYKGDKEKLSAEQMKLYREMGVNPLDPAYRQSSNFRSLSAFTSRSCAPWLPPRLNCSLSQLMSTRS